MGLLVHFLSPEPSNRPALALEPRSKCVADTLPTSQLPRSQAAREGAVLTIQVNFLFGVQQLEPALPLGHTIADIHPNIPGHF